jgi:hypothetical protein
MFYFQLNYSKTFKTKLNPVLTGVPQDWFMCQFHIPFFALARKKRRPFTPPCDFSMVAWKLVALV